MIKTEKPNTKLHIVLLLSAFLIPIGIHFTYFNKISSALDSIKEKTGTIPKTSIKYKVLSSDLKFSGIFTWTATNRVKFYKDNWEHIVPVQSKIHPKLSGRVDATHKILFAEMPPETKSFTLQNWGNLDGSIFKGTSVYEGNTLSTNLFFSKTLPENKVTITKPLRIDIKAQVPSGPVTTKLNFGLKFTQGKSLSSDDISFSSLGTETVLNISNLRYSAPNSIAPSNYKVENINLKTFHSPSKAKFAFTGDFIATGIKLPGVGYDSVKNTISLSMPRVSYKRIKSSATKGVAQLQSLLFNNSMELAGGVSLKTAFQLNSPGSLEERLNISLETPRDITDLINDIDLNLTGYVNNETIPEEPSGFINRIYKNVITPNSTETGQGREFKITTSDLIKGLYHQ